MEEAGCTSVNAGGLGGLLCPCSDSGRPQIKGEWRQAAKCTSIHFINRNYEKSFSGERHSVCNAHTLTPCFEKCTLLKLNHSRFFQEMNMEAWSFCWLTTLGPGIIVWYQDWDKHILKILNTLSLMVCRNVTGLDEIKHLFEWRRRHSNILNRDRSSVHNQA